MFITFGREVKTIPKMVNSPIFILYLRSELSKLRFLNSFLIDEYTKAFDADLCTVLLVFCSG